MKVTKKNLLAAFPKMDKTAALAVVMLCNGTNDPMNHEAARKRSAECYNAPSTTDLILHAINALVGGFGVEGVPYYENAMRDEFIDFVNMGDTYSTTILCNPETGKFEIGDWGSLYETSPAYQAETKSEDEEAV
jgi:hypothetical protein